MPQPSLPTPADVAPIGRDTAACRVEAHRLMRQTRIRRSGATVLVAAFLLTIVGVPLLDHVHAVQDYIREQTDSPLPGAFDALRNQFPASPSAIAPPVPGTLSELFARNAGLLRRMEQFEDTLAETSLVGRKLLPQVQRVLSGWLGTGNEQVYIARAGWLFYRSDVEHVTGPPFLAASRLAHRGRTANEYTSPPQPDPRPAILRFAADLNERGVTLIVVPTPVKATIHPEYLASAKPAPPIHNASHTRLLADLAAAGPPNLVIFDPAPLLVDAARSTGRPQYLAGDTHWTPEAVELIADELAAIIRSRDLLPAGSDFDYRTQAVEVTGSGDIAGMLRLPAGSALYPPQTVTTRQVLMPDPGLWRPDPTAGVLLLGDSYTNIFSLPQLGWGESAGLAEHLSRSLARPVDAITRNDAGSHATRQMLAHELLRGRDRLAGKRVVIYQFAARELSQGDWKILPLELGDPAPTAFYVPPPGRTVRVSATVLAVAPAPPPGSVPYRDHLVAVHLVDIASPDLRPDDADAALAYMFSMRNNEWTPAARLRPGQRIIVQLRPWSDVASQLERLNRAELTHDVELIFAEPVFAEPVSAEPVLSERIEQ